MIILDTNVIAEFMRKEPAPQVTAWVNNIDTNALYTTWINIAEIQRGIFRLPIGKRRDNLDRNFKLFIDKAFSGRVLAFEQSAASYYGSISAERESAGLHIDPVDLMIVAIAKSYQFKIATRNTSDFSACGVAVIDPWIQSK
jgi:predicted nucleic acid-binding protein